MSRVYKTVLTDAGAERLAAAAVSGIPAKFTWMGVGDGGGVLPSPDARQPGLINEVYRSALNSLTILEGARNVIQAELVIPPQNGGFTLREAALYDDEGVCLAVANMPETYKPLPVEGAGKFSVIRINITVSNTDDVSLIVDPGIVLATLEDVRQAGDGAKDYADDQLSAHARSRNHPDATLNAKGFTQLSNEIDSEDEKKAATPAAIKAAVASAIRSAWELDNPVGTVRLFAKNVNPNQRWPWSEWVYTGENKAIRIGKADGSDVGQTGGSDTVTLQQANLPAVQIDVTGETSELPAHELTTRGAGRHKHQGGMAAPGEAWDGDYIVGSDNDSHRTRNNTSEADDHTHIVDVQAHKHNTSGKTDNLGEGKSFSVVEAHTLLMCWSRVA
ncbi:TPA: phage tail protein [Klebsiella pneumoniae]